MARTRRATAPVPEHNSLIASATRMPPVPTSTFGRQQAWQGQAWNYYDTVGELHFVANWVGNVMSRATLVVAERIGDTLIVRHDGPAVEAINAYHGGIQGQQEMLQQVGVHLTVAGECYDTVHGDDEWAVLAYDKVSTSGKEITADFGTGRRTPIKGQSSMAIRIWTPHPRDPLRADAPTRSNIGTLAEIASLNAHVSAQLQSRLAGAGVLWVPNEITFPVPKEADPAASTADAFMMVLAEAMMAPIADRSSPSAVVPIVVQAPGEQLGNIKHMTFWSELDENTVPMREAAVKRLALGLDTPPEVLLGMTDSNHWNAWLVDEAAIKSHLEPRLQVVCQALTDTYLRPSLQGEVGNPDDWYVLADTSDIRLRPNRSKEAIELYDRGELSGQALIRETGFDITDMPAGEERREWLLRKIATGSTSPEQTQAALRLLGADLGNVLPMSDGNAEIAPVLQPRRSLEDHPENAIPDLDRSTKDHDLPSRNASLLAAADVLVFRALERVGNRLANGHARSELGQVSPQWRYLTADTIPENVLDGCWTFAAEVLEGKCTNQMLAAGAIDGYVRYLLDNRVKHDAELMESRLAQAGL